MRKLFELTKERNAKIKYSSFLLTIETFYPYNGKIAFKEYNPNKPAKYRLLYRNLRDSKKPYIIENIDFKVIFDLSLLQEIK